MNVEVGGGPPNGVSEGVGVGLGVEVFEGVSVIVGVAVMVGVGVRVSGTNGVAVGRSVGVALGIGEGRARVPDEPGCPKGATIPELPGVVGSLGTNEPIGTDLARSNKPARPAALEELADAAKINPLTISNRARLISPARVRAILRFFFLDSI